MNVTKFNLDNIRDSTDIKNLRGQLQSIEGVHAVRVDNVANTVTVEYEDNLDRKKLTSAIDKYKTDSH